MDDSWETTPFDAYLPSISDNLKINVYSKDCTSQTEVSDIVQLKELAQILSVLNVDVINLKKDIFYAKRSMQAQYQGKLEEISFELYSQANQRITEIEKIQEERVNVVRKSYKTQLADAICKLSKDYHRFYGKKGEQSEDSHKKQMKDLEVAQLNQKQNELAQQEVMELMKLQMEAAQANSDEQVEPSRAESVISITPFINEIADLKSSMKETEGRLEYLEDMLEETNSENSKLGVELDKLSSELSDEQNRSEQLQLEMSKIRKKMEQERVTAKEKLAAQKEKLQKEMEEKMASTKKKAREQAQKELNEVKELEDAKLKQMKMAEEKRVAELMKQQHEMVTREKTPQVPVDKDFDRMMELDRKQRIEIAKLQKELERTNKTWDMKVIILQQTMHALKDEMFLRSSLQRQSAKVQHAAITYAGEGPISFPVGILPTKSPVPVRRHQLPNIIQAPQLSTSTPLNDGRSTGPLQPSGLAAQVMPGHVKAVIVNCQDTTNS